MYLSTCSAPSSDHLPILIDTQCRSSFLSSPDRPDLRRTDWPNLQACLGSGLPSNPDLRSEVTIDACVKELSKSISKTLIHSTPKFRPRADPRSPLPASMQDEIRPKNQLRKQWQITREPAIKAEVNRLQRSVTTSLTSGGMNC